jgi:hypothetical protein
MQCDQADVSANLILRSDDIPQTRTASRLHLDECRPFSAESAFGGLVCEEARRVGVEPRALAVRVLLHLPRVASYKGWVTRSQVQRELRISAERLQKDVLAASPLVSVGKFSLYDLAFEAIDAYRAIRILRSLHYLRSARPGSIYFALVDPIDRRPVTLCGISPLQWKCVEREVRAKFALPPERVWDVSRVFSVNSAPPNAISLLLSRVRKYVRQNLSYIDLLATAVDPNLGFTGSSYRAANWQQWVTIKARPYFYERTQYASPRQLRERYGTASIEELHAKHPGRFQQSRARLLDSMIFCSSVNEKTKVVLAQEMHRLHR